MHVAEIRTPREGEGSKLLEIPERPEDLVNTKTVKHGVQIDLP